MATSLYFNNLGHSGQQNLIEDLIIESIKINGIDVQYLPRTLVKEDHLYGEDVLSKFDDAYPLEMYVKDVTGFTGDGHFLSKFNIEIRDEMTFTLSVRRFEQEVSSLNSTPVNEAVGVNRPAEGDIIYFPLNGKIFEVKHVDFESIFYQMGSLQTYDLTCEVFEYSHEVIDTGITEIDTIEDIFSGDKFFFKMLAEDGDTLITEDSDVIIQDDYRIEDTDAAANNEFFQTSSDFIDFSDLNPFSEGPW